MRVSSINVSQPRNLNYQIKAKKLQSNPVQTEQPSFKGGASGTLLGSIVGIGLTVVSGGALAWTIPVLGGIGGIAGDASDSKNNSNSDDYNRSYDDLSGFDFIG